MINQFPESGIYFGSVDRFDLRLYLLPSGPVSFEKLVCRFFDDFRLLELIVEVHKELENLVGVVLPETKHDEEGDQLVGSLKFLSVTV